MSHASRGRKSDPDRQARTEEAARRQRGPGRPRVGGPDEETVATTVRLPASWVERLDELAEEGQSRADVVRGAVGEWLDSQPDDDR